MGSRRTVARPSPEAAGSASVSRRDRAAAAGADLLATIHQLGYRETSLAPSRGWSRSEAVVGNQNGREAFSKSGDFLKLGESDA